jgi:hypothetical protein
VPPFVKQLAERFLGFPSRTPLADIRRVEVAISPHRFFMHGLQVGRQSGGRIFCFRKAEQLRVVFIALGRTL